MIGFTKKIKISSLVFAFIIASFLSGCASKVPEVTDEQVLEFLGSQSLYADKDAPPTISRSIENCMGLLAGLRDDFSEYMAGGTLGMMEMVCRQSLQKLVNNKTKNTYGFTLASFENREFAKRVMVIKQTADEKFRTFVKVRRQKQEEVRLARERLAEQQRLARKKAAEEEQLALEKAAKEKAEAALGNYQQTFAAFVAGLDERLATLPQQCRRHANLLAAAHTRLFNRLDRVITKPEICKITVKEIKKRASENLEKIKQITLTGSGRYWRFDELDFYPNKVSVRWVDQQFQQLTGDIVEMTQMLE